MARILIPLWQNWQFVNTFEEQYVRADCDESHFTEVQLPHTVKELPYHYFDEKVYQFESCYRKKFAVSPNLQGMRLFVDFDGLMCYARVFINGHFIGEHKGGYVPFSVEITHYVEYGDTESNVLAVYVDSTERADIPPFGGEVDYLCYGGIYRDVILRAVPHCHIESIYARPISALTAEKSLQVDIAIAHDERTNKSIDVSVAIFDSRNRKRAELSRSLEVAVPSLTLSMIMDELTGLKLWTLEKPELYRAEVSLLEDGLVCDTVSTRIGFRTVEFTPEGFFLNGKLLKLRGLNRHQSFPYVGYAMPERVQRKDADILKYELGVNIVRTSHYPQSPYFLDRCDEIGLLVFEETPGWQHIGDSAWQDVTCENIRKMITRDRNHPSIVLWGVRINESPDCTAFYQQTNTIAHELDPYRQTGGVRCIENSEFFEDVYTMNDFTCGVQGLTAGTAAGAARVLRSQREVTGLSDSVPYLVTEFGGHMYPTKRFDQEERLVEHAKLHLAVQNAAALDPQKCGAIGWCAFDYNTHANFGSGDCICYHGVMDMFRIPKFAASVYASQQPVEMKPVLEPLTRYTVGDRAVGGIAPLIICTNCTAVRLSIGKKDLGLFYPAFDRYPGLAHPPVVIDNLPSVWGGGWEDAVFTGYHNGMECITRRFSANPVATQLVLTADETKLRADIPDAVRFVVQLLDQVGNELPYSFEIVKITLKGPAKIIGPQEFALIGGARGFWIKTLGKAGTAKVSAQSGEFKTETVSVRIR
jgi:beta-galactosidase